MVERARLRLRLRVRLPLWDRVVVEVRVADVGVHAVTRTAAGSFPFDMLLTSRARDSVYVEV